MRKILYYIILIAWAILSIPYVALSAVIGIYATMITWCLNHLSPYIANAAKMPKWALVLLDIIDYINKMPRRGRL